VKAGEQRRWRETPAVAVLRWRRDGGRETAGRAWLVLCLGFRVLVSTFLRSSKADLFSFYTILTIYMDKNVFVPKEIIDSPRGFIWPKKSFYKKERILQNLEMFVKFNSYTFHKTSDFKKILSKVCKNK
jgi:hypothetical protein